MRGNGEGVENIEEVERIPGTEFGGLPSAEKVLPVNEESRDLETEIILDVAFTH